jgi:hypothetical protein
LKVKAKRGERWERKLREEVKSLELGLGRNRVSVKERVSIMVTYILSPIEPNLIPPHQIR